MQSKLINILLSIKHNVDNDLTNLNEKLISKLNQHINFDSNLDNYTIDNLVNSRKKEDRISVGGNPNLTYEQQKKLSKDKVNAVRESLCYNKNLDPKIALNLVEEEPDRLYIIKKYGNLDVHEYILKNFSNKNNFVFYGYIFNLISEYTKIPSKFNNKILNILVDLIIEQNLILSDRIYELYNFKYLPKEITNKLIHAFLLIKRDNDDNLLTNLLVSQKIPEKELLKLDWKKDDRIRSALLASETISKQNIIKILRSMHGKKDANTLGLSLSEKINPNFRTPEVLNEYLEFVLSLNLRKVHFDISFDIFKNTSNIDLDSDLLIKVIQKIQKEISEKYYDIKYLIANNNIPDNAINKIKIKSSDIMESFISRDVLSEKTLEQIIDKYIDNFNLKKGIIEGLKKNKNVKISTKYQKMMLEKYTIKENIAQIIRGDFLSYIIENLDKLDLILQDLSSYRYVEIMIGLAKNNILTFKQRKKIFEKIKKNKKLIFYNNADKENFLLELLIHRDNTKFFIKEILQEKPEVIFKLWDIKNYYPYLGKNQSIIDEYFLSMKKIPSSIFDFYYSNFTEWVKKSKMSKETAFRYLDKCIKDGDEKMKQKLLNFVDDIWINRFGDIDIKTELYYLTNDPKYLSDFAKNALFIDI